MHYTCIVCSDSVVIIGIGMPKKKRIELKTRMHLYIINPSLYSALIPAQYALVTVVMCVAHDNDVMPVSLLRSCMVSNGLSHSIIEYMPNRL